MKKNERTEQDFRDAAKKSFSIAGMCRELGLGTFGANYRRIHKAIKEYNIDTSHFTGCGWNVGLKFNPNEQKKYSLGEILVENSKYDNSNRLKSRLIEEGLKEYRCEKCKRTEWEGQAIPLQLHHINGDRTDNRLENLQVLCPNCHALTDNYCGKNTSTAKAKKLTENKKVEKVNSVYGEEFASSFFEKIRKHNHEERFCEKCGKKIEGRDKHRKKYCSNECYYEAMRKLPDQSKLKEKLDEFGWNKTKTGEYFGVTDSSIRKWIKKYKIENPNLGKR